VEVHKSNAPVETGLRPTVAEHDQQQRLEQIVAAYGKSYGYSSEPRLSSMNTGWTQPREHNIASGCAALPFRTLERLQSAAKMMLESQV
jgi:hypothetical protein